MDSGAQEGLAAGETDVTDTKADKKPRQTFELIGIQVFLLGKKNIPLLRPAVKTIKTTAVRQGDP
jgi:hypothetical protein